MPAPDVLPHDELVRMRRRLHEQPELSLIEFDTARFVAETLAGYALDEIRTGVGRTGVLATLRGGRPGPVTLLRADMDALPIRELNAVAYRSQREGVMHACGHDGHVAMALVAAKLLQARRKDLRGTVKLMFQPAEEGPGGAIPMLEEGLLDGPKVDAAFAIHLWNDLPVGKVGCRAGAVFAAQDEFHIKVTGKGGHGAAPHQTIDPVVVAAHIVTACQTIVSRKIEPIRTGVCTFGSVHGGTRHNIIPDTVTLSGTLRSLEQPVRKLLERELARIVHGVAGAFGAAAEIDFVPGYAPTVNDEAMTEVARGAAREAVGAKNVVEQDVTMGAEDMSYVLEKVPGCYMVVGSSNKKRGLVHPHHSAKFDFDEKALEVGTEVWLRLAQASVL
jgi:amidohydrolase